jgi:hypothetical protein
MASPTPTSKSWTYAEVTLSAQEKITEFMATAMQHELAGDTRAATLRRDWAYGVFLSWSALTQGWQQDNGDLMRLEKLTVVRKKRPRPVAKPPVPPTERDPVA